MKIAALAMTLGMAIMPIQGKKSTAPVIIHATVDSESTADFMNGLKVTCPAGYEFPKNVIPGGSYREMFNHLASIRCIRSRSPKVPQSKETAQ